MAMVDEGTDFTVVVRVQNHASDHYAAIIVDHWVAWAGPPDRVVADGERGFASVEFASVLARAGSQYVPPAAYAP